MGLKGPDLGPTLPGEGGEGGQTGLGVGEHLSDLGEVIPQGVDDALVLGHDRLPAGLGEDGRDQGVDELRADAQGSHQLVYASGGDPDQVGVSDHRDQYGLGQLAALEQSVGEVRAGAQLGNSHINGPYPGTGVPVAVAGALGQELGTSPAVLSAAHGIGIRRQQDVDHCLQQDAHQVRGGPPQRLVKDSSKVDKRSTI